MQKWTITSFRHPYFSETVNAEFMTSECYKMFLTANLVQKGLGQCCHFFSSAPAVLNARLPATHYACSVHAHACVCVTLHTPLINFPLHFRACCRDKNHCTASSCGNDFDGLFMLTNQQRDDRTLFLFYACIHYSNCLKCSADNSPRI